jgi:hypothetical protein
MIGKYPKKETFVHLHKLDELMFAKLSFLHDLSNDCYEESPKIKQWQDLPQTIKDSYMEEAKYYFPKPISDWPEDILKRFYAVVDVDYI